MVCDLVVVVVGWRSMNSLGKYCCKGGGGGCAVGMTITMCACYPGSNGGVGVYMVTAIVVVRWCVRACGEDSSSGVLVVMVCACVCLCSSCDGVVVYEYG